MLKQTTFKKGSKQRWRQMFVSAEHGQKIKQAQQAGGRGGGVGCEGRRKETAFKFRLRTRYVVLFPG